jgi:nucleoside-diphosphate-sugar epimerase
MSETPAPPVLITGATGFIAANFVYQFAAHGHRVVAYDVNPPIPLLNKYWAPYAENITFETGSVTDAARMSEVGNKHKPDRIVHAAAITAVDPVTEAQMGARMVEVNVMGTVRALELGRALNVKRLVYISSSGVYGFDDPNTIPETAELPRARLELYGISKRASEELCLRYAELLGMSIAIGRLNGPYGPMEQDTGVRPLMSPIYQIAQMAFTRNLVRIRNTDGAFDWTYVLDLAESVRLLAMAPTLSNQIYNLSSGVRLPFTDVVKEFGALLPPDRLQLVDADAQADLELNLPKRGALSIARLEEDVGYKPAYDLKQGLATSLPWWREMVELEQNAKG